MIRFVIAFIIGVLPIQVVYADDADPYIHAAEYYQKKAAGYRREAAYYLKKAEYYQREAAYYTKKGKTDQAKTYQRKATRALDDYKTQLRYAANADDKAADYLKRASRITARYVTFGNYEYERIGPGHGGYAETFHTFDLKTEEKLTNADIFKSQNLDRVKMALFEVMAKDKKYRASYGDSISPSEAQALIEGWQSPNPLFKGTEWEESDEESEFELPEGALTDTGVVFSFQPYEIDCWAAGAYHFIVPYKRLIPYMTKKAKRLIGKFTIYG